MRLLLKAPAQQRGGLMADANGFDALGEKLGGRLVRPDDGDYDAVRSVWNGMIDRRPAAIAQCRTREDVVHSLEFVRAERLPLSVRCGGHGVAGSAVCDGGLMIDLSPMNHVRVDPDSKTATVAGGAQLGELDRATQAHGLAVTAGVDPTTGVGGLTLGGGTGFLARKLGLTIDSLVGAEIVLADGSVVEASESEHPDLFWAIRGGGGNFGIVTRFDFKLHEIGPQLATAQIFYPFGSAGKVLRQYRDFMAEAPDEVGCFALLVPLPPLEAFPSELHGKTALAIVASYAGDVERGEQLLEQLASFAEPLAAIMQPMAYVDLQSAFKDAAPAGQRYYWKAHFVNEVPDDLIELVIDRARELPGSFSNTFFEPMGGAIARVGETETAFANRDAQFIISMSAGWSDPAKDEELIALTRDFFDAVAPYATGGVYTNYMDFDEKERVRTAYGENYERLRKVKARYDPDNLFRMNQNIPPEG
jgi:FAD/FMN-containing dehydrogenase